MKKKKEWPDEGLHVRFEHSDHRYDKQEGIIVVGNRKCCLIHFTKLNRIFGPCGCHKGDRVIILDDKGSTL